METVYVFAIVDGFDYFLFGDVLGQRELYDKAVHVGIFVKFAYFGQQFVFGHIAFITDKGRFETAYFTGFYFSFLNHLPKAPGWVLTALPNNTYTK